MTSPSTDRRYGVAPNLGIKAPCRTATTVNITLSGLQSIDGITTLAGDRVLVKNQTTSSDNGIYVADSGAWTRDIDCNANRDIARGTIVPVTDGASTAGLWQCNGTNPIVIGTSAITFSYLPANSSGALVSFLQAGIGAIADDLQSRGRWVVYATDFMSVADRAAIRAGTQTDVTTAAQAALDSLQATYGGTILLPAGSLKLTATIKNATPKPWAIEGQGEQSTLIAYTGNAHALWFSDLPSASPFGGLCSAKKMAFTGTAGTSLGAIRITNSVGSFVERIVARNFTTDAVVWYENSSNAIFCEAATIRDLWVTNCLYAVKTTVSGTMSSFDEMHAERVYGSNFPNSGHLFHLQGNFNKALFISPTMFVNDLVFGVTPSTNNRMFHFVSTGGYNIGNHTIINPHFDGDALSLATAAVIDYNHLVGGVCVIHPYSNVSTFILNADGLTTGMAIVRPGQTRSIYLPPQAFTLVQGAAAITNYAGGGNPYDISVGIAFDAAADEGVTTNLHLPQDFQTYRNIPKIRLHWAATTAGAGNVVWQIAVKYITENVGAGDYWNGVKDEIFTVTTPANGFAQLETYSDVAPGLQSALMAPLNNVRLCVQRLGSAGGDTYAADVALFGVEIVYVSAGDKNS